MDDHGFASKHGVKTNTETSAWLLPKYSSSLSGASQSDLGEKSTPASLRQRILCDTWFYEYIAVLFSIACLIAIGTVLMVYDQRSAPQLKYGLTLNAIISVLATGSKAGLTFAVASCISQLKWSWVQKKQRPLRDLQTYDDASRGISGAISMLFTRSGLSLASIGAIITIVAVVFDPFVQQLLAYPIRNVPKGSASALTKQAAVFSVEGAPYDSSFVAAVNAGIWANSGQFARNPICTSGNCTWPAFRSVGWCSKCEDITSSVSVSGCNFTVDTTPTRHNNSGNNSHDHRWYDVRREFPCGLSLGKGAPVDLSFWESAKLYHDGNYTVAETTLPKEVVWAGYGIDSNEVLLVDGPKSVLHNTSFNGVETPLMAFVHASLKLINETYPPKGLVVSRGEQCVLSLCEKTYKTSVANGIHSSGVLSKTWGGIYYWDAALKKTIQDSYVHVVESPDGGDNVLMYWLANPEERDNVFFPFTPGSWFNSDPAHSAFLLDATWYESIASRVKGTAKSGWVLNGDVETTLSGKVISRGGWSRDADPVRYSSDAVEAISTKGLSTVIGNIAASLTRLGLDQSNMTVSGTINVPEVYVHVRWEWFTLPCFLELAGIGFLITTIIVSEHQNVRTWKSSIHALLYHGLERELLHEHAVEDTVSGMQQRARSVVVRLKMSENRDRVALRRDQGPDVGEL